MGDSRLYYVVRHRRLLKDWSHVLVLCDGLLEAQEESARILNSIEDIAEVEMHDPLSGRTTSTSPLWRDGDKVEILPEDIK